MKRLACILVFSVLVAGITARIAISQQKAYPVLKAQKFELVDANGDTVATLTAENGGAVLFLANAGQSKASATLTVGKEDAGLMLMDKAGRSRIIAVALPDGSAAISMNHANGNRAITAMCGAKTDPYIKILDAAGSVIWRSGD